MINLTQQIKELEETLLRRHTRADRKMLQTLLHDEFEEVGASGDIVAKVEAIEWLLREDDNIQWSLSDFKIRCLSEDLVLATYYAYKIDLTTGVRKQSVRCSLWMKTISGWMLRFHQGTKLTAEL